jgi:hypothetical protein
MNFVELTREPRRRYVGVDEITRRQKSDKPALQIKLSHININSNFQFLEKISSDLLRGPEANTKEDTALSQMPSHPS